MRIELIAQSQYKQIMDKLKKERPDHKCKKTDIKRLFIAMINDDFTEVKNSSFYRLHGGDYCQLQSILYSLNN